MKMKKLTALAALILALLMLTACGKKSASPKPAEQETEQPPVAEDVLPMQVLSAVEYNYIYENDSYDAPCLVKTQWPAVALAEESREQYPALAAALDAYTVKEHEQGMESLKQMEADAREQYEYAPETFEYCYYTSDSTARVVRADDKVFSMAIFGSDYMGGAHPVSGWIAKTYDTATGEELTLSDVLPEQEGLYDIIIDAIMTESENFDEDELKTVFANADYYPAGLTWTLGYDHMGFYFGDYELGSYAQGSLYVAVPFAALEGLIAPEYTEAPETYGFSLTELYSSYDYMDLLGDGTMQCVCAYGVPADNAEDSYNGLRVEVNGATAETMGLEFSDYQASVLRTANGDTWVYVECSVIYEEITEIFRIPAGTLEPEYVGAVHQSAHKFLATKSDYGYEDYGADNTLYMRYLLTDPAYMTLENNDGVFGYNRAIAAYCVGEEGLPEQISEYYVYDSDEPFFLLANIPAHEIDPQTGDMLGDVTVTEEAEVYLDCSDEATFAEFWLTDGSLVLVDLTQDENGALYIDGAPIYEVLDGISVG